MCVQVHGLNCFTARWNWEGIAATADTRAPHDVAGQRLKIRFEIVDRRFGVLAGPVKKGEVDPNRVQRGPYTVHVTLQVLLTPPARSMLPCCCAVWTLGISVLRFGCIFIVLFQMRLLGPPSGSHGRYCQSIFSTV